MCIRDRKYNGNYIESVNFMGINNWIQSNLVPTICGDKKGHLYVNTDYSIIEYGHEVGFDRCYALEDVLVENDIIEKSSGGVYKFKGKTLARGEEKFQKLLEEDDELRRKLLKKAEINTIGTTRKKIVALTTNLYPDRKSVV